MRELGANGRGEDAEAERKSEDLLAAVQRFSRTR
jgi:hypothetical protein